MPRPRVKYKARAGVPSGVRDSVTALALDGSLSPTEIATLYGVDVSTVRRLAASIGDIDPEHVALLKRALPSLLAVLATRHTLAALERADSDPATAVKSTFGAKLAVEAGKLSQPQADRPGAHMLAFVKNLNVNVGQSIGEKALESVLVLPKDGIVVETGEDSNGEGPPPDPEPLALASEQPGIEHDGDGAE